MAKNKFFNGILVLGFLIVFFMPRSFQFIPVVSFIYAHAFWLQCVFFAAALGVTVVCRFRNVMDRVFVGIVALLITEGVACLAHGGDYSVLYHHAVLLISVYLIVTYAMEECPHLFLRFAAWYFTLLIVINLVLLFLMPKGIGQLESYSSGMRFKQVDRMNFLEVDNRLSMPIGTAILTTALLMDRGRRYRVLLVIAMAAGILTNLRTRSGTGIISSFVLVAYILVFYYRKRSSRLINLFNLIVIYSIMTAFVIFASRIPAVQMVVQDWLKKDLTFSGRTDIWQYCLEKVSQSPVFGVGNLEQGWTIYWHDIARNAHNLFLDVLYEGGIVMAAGYLVLLGAVLTRVASVHTKKGQLMLVFLFSVFLVMLCESFFYNNYMYMFYALACCPAAIEKRDGTDRKLGRLQYCLRNV